MYEKVPTEYEIVPTKNKLTDESKSLLDTKNSSINNYKEEDRNKICLLKRCYLDFIYFCARYSLPESALKYLLVRREKKCIHPPVNLTNFYDIMSVLLAEKFFGNFLLGTRFVSDTLYPVLLFGMLICDSVSFARLPQARVGNKFLQFLYWFSDTRYITTSEWPRSWWYIWTPAIIGGSIFLGVVSCFAGVTSCSKKILMFASKKTGKQKTNETRLHDKERKKIKKKIQRINQLIAIITLLSSDKNNVTYISEKKKEGYLEKIKEYLKDQDKKDQDKKDQKHNIITILTAINALAIIIDEFREGRIRWLTKKQQKICRKLKQKAVQMLKKVAKQNKIYALKNFSFLKKIYANYSLWSNGISYQNCSNSLFWIPTIFLWYSQYRLLLSIIQPLIEYITFKIKEYECTSQSKVYVYTQSSGSYECSICGDWPEVYYKDIFAAQSCMDALLQTKQPVAKIIAALERMLPFGISNINFNQQHLYARSDLELQQVFNLTHRVSNGSLNFFNLGSVLQMTQPFSYSQAAVIIDSLRKFEISNISFDGSYFPVNVTALVLDSITNRSKNVSVVNLSNMHLGQMDALHLSKSLLKLKTLNAFIANQNLFDNELMHFLCPVLSKMNLTELSLVGNIFDEYGIAKCSKYPFPNLQKLDLSDLELETTNLTAVKPLLENPNLIEFSFRNNGVDVLNLPTFIGALSRSNLKKLDLSCNHLTSYACYILGSALQNSTVHTLILNDNPLSDYCAEYLKEFLPKSLIKKLGLSRVGFSDVGIKAFSQYFPQTKIIDFDLSGNQITELGMCYFAPALELANNVTRMVFDDTNIGNEGLDLLLKPIEKHQETLRTISLHNTGVTHPEQLFKKLQNATSLETLRLSKNSIEESDYVRALELLNRLSIKNLDLRDTEITNSVMQVLIQQLPGSTITTLKLDDNFLGNKLTGGFIEKLVEVPIDVEALMEESIGFEDMRIIHAAPSNTNLTAFSFRHANISTEIARAICRILPSTNINIKFLSMGNNFIDESQVNLISCHVSSASRARPPSIFIFFERMVNGIYKLSTSFLKKLSGSTIIPFAFTDSSALVPFVPLRSNRPDIFLDCVINNKGLQCRGMAKTSNGEISYFDVMAQVVHDQFPVIQLKKLFFSCIAAVAFAFRNEILQLSKPFAERLIKKYFPKSFSLEDFIWLSKFYQTSHEKPLIDEFGSIIICANCDPISTLVHDITYTVKKMVKNSKPKLEKKSEEIITKSAKALLTLGGGFGIAYAVNVLTGNPLVGYTLMPFISKVISKVPKIYNKTKKTYNKNGFWSAVNTAFEEICYSVPGGDYVRKVS
jgi:hypothetical protein